ncbi:MAG TPA: MoxR family ATPase [Candidatus Sumerlaeota bacterium]|nr:MoxR family ATPase [Candidatus Sumerlaeota bacterium]
MSLVAVKKIREGIESVILGKPEVVEKILAALFSGGHVLIEDVPGLGKTILARALAMTINADFKRIQFTPDLLPTDITGVAIFNQEKRAFEFREGPIFTNILLADELNRATPRTQSALLECMEERQISADGKTMTLPDPFFVIATQNPVEQQGVYHLPEAQLDRFLVQLTIGYPKHFIEMSILESQKKKHPIADVKAAASVSEILSIQQQVRNVYVDETISDYIVAIVEQTREHPSILLGASPRGSLALYRMSQAIAWMAGEEYVRPDAVKKLVLPVLRHRLILKPQARLGGLTPDQVLQDILEKTPVPVSRPPRGKESGE